MSSVGEDFPNELHRVKELLTIYRELGPTGAFGAIMIQQVIYRAEKAWANQDVVEILRAYQELKDCK